jgi:ribonuclease VapC
MVIDTSAIIAILLGEAEADVFARVISHDPKRLMSVFTYLESSIVIEAKKGDAGSREFDLLINRAGIEIVGMEQGQVEIARNAWRTFGKGRHPAGLNIGDCCSYALSKYSGEPLLFKGADFSATDVAVVDIASDKEN